MFGNFPLRLFSFKHKSLSSQAKTGMVIVHIGVGDTYIIQLLSKKVGLSGHIHVFEADYELFCRLQSIFIPVKFPQIILRNQVLLHKNGPHTLDIINESYLNSLYVIVKHFYNIGIKYVFQILSRNQVASKSIHFLNKNKKILPTKKIENSDNIAYSTHKKERLYHCSTLDDYSRVSLLNLDLLILNVNGYAAQILLGAFNTIRTFRPIIAIVFTENSLRQKGFCSHFLLQWMKALGYIPYDHAKKTTFEVIESKAETDHQWRFEIIFKPERNLIKQIPSVINLRFNQNEDKLSSRDMKSLKYLYAYPALTSEIQSSTESRLSRIRSRGYNVTGFCLPLKSPGPLLTWPELDDLWLKRDTDLLNKYEQLTKVLDGHDVLINYGGANLHPEFVRQLPTFNVFTCHDDPEASEHLSHYIAPDYDFSLVGNAGCIDMYHSWGIQNVSFLPLGVYDSDRDLTITEESILNGRRFIPIVFLASRDKHRDLMLNPLLKAFPETVIYGYGWPNSFLPQNQQVALYCNSQIGWNMDQSVGPATSRTFKLPANGVLLIGNNSTHLERLFKLGVEAIGFDTVKECIDYTHYYLAHDEERREIAARGWSHTIKNYTEDKIWQSMLQTIKPFI